MSVEDIDYLVDNSVQDNFILYIDSASRNRSAYPHPNEYVVAFDEPFKFVYGIDILDASIPSTMYNVDTNNNTLRLGQYKMYLPAVNSIYEQDKDVPSSKTFGIFYKNLQDVVGFDVFKNDTNVMNQQAPFTYKIVFTTPAVLTSGFLEQTTLYKVIFSPYTDMNEMINDFNTNKKLLTLEQINDLFYQPVTRGSKHVLCVTEKLPTPAFSILTATEVESQVASRNLQIARVYNIDKNVCKYIEYTSSAPRNVTAPQTTISQNSEISLFNQGTITQNIYFQFIHASETLYIKWYDSDAPPDSSVNTIIDVITKSYQSEKDTGETLTDKLLKGPATTFALKRILTRFTSSKLPTPPNNGKFQWIVNTIYYKDDEEFNPGSLIVESETQPKPYSYTSYEVYLYHFIPTSETAQSNAAFGSVNGFAQLMNSNLYYVYLSFLVSRLTPGNYSITNFLTEAKRALSNTGVSVDNSYIDDITIRPNLRFSSKTPFFFDMDLSTINTVMGFDEFSYSTNGDLYEKLFYNDNKRLFGSLPADNPEVAMNNSTTSFKLTSPGVVYLLGTRYCILRCEELDDHLYGSRSYGKWSPGIALFKMFNVNDVAHQRIDFVNFQKKPFHPLGRLDRITLRFETSDGSLYDFKGANHLLILSIKFYVPTQKNKMTKSILNPNYQQDYMNYFITRQVAYKDPPEGDEEEEELTAKAESFAGRFLQKHLKYETQIAIDAFDGDSSSASEFDFYGVQNAA